MIEIHSDKNHAPVMCCTPAFANNNHDIDNIFIIQCE